MGQVPIVMGYAILGCTSDIDNDILVIYSDGEAEQEPYLDSYRGFLQLDCIV
jgi:hypothetical protein